MLFSYKSKKYFGFIVLGCLFIFMLSRAKYGYIYNAKVKPCGVL